MSDTDKAISKKKQDKQKQAISIVDYILDSEYNSYMEYCEEEGLDPYEKHHTGHIYGLVSDYFDLDVLMK